MPPVPSSPPSPFRPRKWDVIHACDHARQVADLLDAQATANIRAYVLSRARVPGDSLLQSWNEVRKWRTQLDEHCGEVPFDSAGLIVHAHSFTAGMAAIRGEQPAVYDLAAFIDQLPIESNRTWLARSFRAAEQFVLAQSAAIIVPNAGMKQEVATRGVPAERIFLVPAAVPLLPDTAPAEALRRRLAIAADDIIVFTEAIDAPLAEALLAARADGSLSRVLMTEPAATDSRALAVADQLAQFSISLSPEQYGAACAAAQLVVAATDDVLACAMAHGRAALAVDSEATRSVSPDGAGLLWSDAADPGDRARRLTRLLRESAFRQSLADAARRYLTEARSLERIGKLYEEVYRYAAQVRRPTKIDTPRGSLVPVTAHL